MIKRIWPDFEYNVWDYRDINGAHLVALKLLTYVRKLGQNDQYYLVLVTRSFRDCRPEDFKERSQTMGENTSMKQWYLWHFQKI